MENFVRRTVLKSIGAAGVTWMLPGGAMVNSKSVDRKLKFGIIADLHGGFVRDAESRLDVFLNAVKKEPCDGLIQLGDFAFPNAKHQKFADKFNAAHDTRIHIIGNHEFDYELKREDCYKAWGIESSYYSRDVGGLQVIVLDGNDTGSPTHESGYPSYIGGPQREWLQKQLEQSDKPVLILSHQPLAGSWPIDNAKEIQRLFGTHKDKILLCINGHSHIDQLVEVSGVHYLHMNSASYFWVGGEHRTAFYAEPLYAMLTIDPTAGTISIEGKSSTWKRRSPEELGYFKNKQNPPPESDVVAEIRSRKLNA